jgi:hypothetical protein
MENIMYVPLGDSLRKYILLLNAVSNLLPAVSSMRKTIGW